MQGDAKQTNKPIWEIHFDDNEEPFTTNQG